MATASIGSSKVKKRTDICRDTGVVLHEGWAVKESGTAMFGKTNWRKRWFRLVQRGHSSTTLEYYKSHKDKTPAGYVHLNVTYCTHQVEDRLYPNCFAVGPLLEDGATRTYYISCSNQLMMQEWIAVIDAAIQGIPDQIHKRRQTVNKVFAQRYKNKLKENKEQSYDQSSLEEESSEIETSQQQEISTVECCLPNEKLSREELTDEELTDELDDDIIEATPTPISPTRSGLDIGLTLQEKRESYESPQWRLQQWNLLCDKVKTTTWAHIDTKDNVTIARCRFGRSNLGHAIMKIEGILPAEPKNVYQFLCLSTREGGKLDYLFRNETIIEDIASFEPQATVIHNEFQPPLPRLTKRDIVAMKIWIPTSLTSDGKGGLVMFSIDHPDVGEPQHTRISIDTSGCVLSPHPTNTSDIHTKMTIFVQVAFYGAMHKMLKGAYNSGLLKLGFRTTFSLIAEQLNKYIEVTNI